MEANLWAVVLGAAIASVAPLITLREAEKRWRLEKRIENLRLNHSRLERIYSQVLEQLPSALSEGSYPSTLTSSVSVYASPEVRKLYFDNIKSKERDPGKLRVLFLDIALAVNQHLSAIEQEIEAVFK